MACESGSVDRGHRVIHSALEEFLLGEPDEVFMVQAFELYCKSCPVRACGDVIEVFWMWMRADSEIRTFTIGVTWET